MRLKLMLPAAVATIALLGGVLPASAGTNGQQIKMFELTNVGSVCIYGYNQNAVWTLYCPSAPASIYNVNTYNGYWWKTYFGTNPGLDYYASGGSYLGSNSCYVPEYQSGSNYTTCNSVS